MSECVFCDIIEGKAPCQSVGEWDDCIAIVPLNPVTDGHVLVMPRTHVRDAVSYPDLTGVVMKRVALLAGDRAPCNIITSVGALATQTVFHLHVHIVPRRENDKLPLPWTSDIALQQIMDARITELEGLLEEAQLRSIEARNPGIDMDEVREHFRKKALFNAAVPQPLGQTVWMMKTWR